MRDVHYVLNQYPADCRPARIEPLGAAGGMSGAVFWRVAAPRGDLVLRRWPRLHPAAERLRFIHAVLRHAYERGVAFLPVPVNTRDGGSFVEHAGHLWELAPWMPGAADYEQSPSEVKLRAAMTALARFHLAVADIANDATPQVAGSAVAVSKRLSRLRELQSGGTAQLSGAITEASWPDLAPLARAFIALLPRAVPRAMAQLEPHATVALPLQPCLRDIWHDHVLFTGDEVTGMIDFGAVAVDTPATDVARLLGSLVGDDRDRCQTGLAAYSEQRPLSEQEGRAISALDQSGTILAGCNWIRWLYVEGRQFENREQVVVRFARLLKRLRAI